MNDLGKFASQVGGSVDVTEWALPGDRGISFLEWGVIIAVGLLDIILARITGIPMSEPVNNAKLLAIIVALWLLTAVLTRASGFGIGCEVIVETVVKFFLFTLVASILSYYLATNPAPLNDALMVKVDSLLGFSWPNFFAWVSNQNQLV